MINETRNELLLILDMVKETNDKKLNIEMLLERFESDILRQLKDLNSKKQELQESFETLEYVRKELGIK